ncbi:hypothetical protein ACFO9Q_11115 [Paenibacillus sp. GCM10023252]|uniref:hypothetical protein n=1 Tax=Paenibacillus sp. GCM10023252 TaxID=3252649 RepID=UPI0036230A2F
MMVFLFILGLIVLVIGPIVGVMSSDLATAAISIACGGLLIGLSKLIEMVEDIKSNLLRAPLTTSQVATIIKNTMTYEIESKGLEIELNSENENGYSVIRIEDDYYIAVSLFSKYLTKNEEEYIFALPRQDVITLYLEYNYYKEVGLFKVMNEVYVNLSKLNVQPIFSGNSVTLKYIQD